MLAGMSSAYYLRLEQGRDAHPSGQVVDATRQWPGSADDADGQVLTSAIACRFAEPPCSSHTSPANSDRLRRSASRARRGRPPLAEVRWPGRARSGAAAGGKGVRPQPHQGLGRLDLNLGHQHPGGLTHLGPRQRVQLGPGIAVGVSNRGL
jgi:hypothetical protein